MVSSARQLPPAIAVHEVLIPAGLIELRARVTKPVKAVGIVIFAHLDADARGDPQIHYIADVLHEQGFATVVVDTLIHSEENAGLCHRSRFVLPQMAHRLIAVSTWSSAQRELQNLEYGYFGNGMGTAAALIAAAGQQHLIRAVVSRSGRPDLAGEHLSGVKAPVLLLAGGRDRELLRINRQALDELNPDCCLDVIPRASARFKEAGTLESVAQLAAGWFSRHIG